MSKINKAVTAAFLADKNLRTNNTDVQDGDVYLFGNRIAIKVDDDTIQINCCDWVTPTTISRLNDIISTFTDGQISIGIKKGEPELRYIDGTKLIIPRDGRYTIYA